MPESADNRKESAASDGTRRREALVGQQDRILRMLADEKTFDDDKDRSDAGGAPRTITYRGQTIEVADTGSGTPAASAGVSYRGSTVDGAPTTPSSGTGGKRRGRRNGSEADEAEAKLRRLKGLLDDGILTEEEFAEKKRELIGLL